MGWLGKAFGIYLFLFLLFPFHAKPGLTRPGDQKRTQDEPKTELRRLSWLILAIFVPTSCQEGPNLKPTSAKMGQLVAKIAQNSSPSSSRPPPHPSKSDGGSFVFALSLFFGEIALEIPKMFKLFPKWSSWPSWPA